MSSASGGTTGSLASTVGAANPLRYRGYYYDTETGLYYLQTRYYDPQVGRFISADALASTGQGVLGYNMFAYCGNNPVIYIDITGAAYTVCLTASTNPDTNLPTEGVGGGGGVLLLLLAVALSEKDDPEPKAIKYDVSGDDSPENKYTVYFLYACDDPNREIIYVGRVITANISSRMSYHKNKGRDLAYSISGLTYGECRMLEQVGMVFFHSINRGNPLFNQIRGVRIGNPNGYAYGYALIDLVYSGRFNVEGLIPDGYILNYIEEAYLNKSP